MIFTPIFKFHNIFEFVSVSWKQHSISIELISILSDGCVDDLFY